MSKDPIHIIETIAAYGLPSALVEPLMESFSADDTHKEFKLLIAIMLSARAKDATILKVSLALFEKYPTPKHLMEVSLKELETMLFQVGFYRNKAIYTQKIAHHVHHHGMPTSRDELVALPGVGRKVANLLIAYCYNIPAICVDIHVHRIFNRLGVISTKTPLETERALMEIYPKGYWAIINRVVVAFGQNICLPRNPQCDKCKLRNICDFYKSLTGNSKEIL